MPGTRVKAMRYTIPTVAALLVLLAYVIPVSAQVLGEYKLPYKELQVPGTVKAAYFDGVRLWVVYEEGSSTHIALYTLSNGRFVPEWIATVNGRPVRVAVDNNLKYLAVITDVKILAVYDVQGNPVLLLDRGFRYEPAELALVSTSSSNTPDVVLVVDKGDNGYWVYAYPLHASTQRAELWLVPENVNTNLYTVMLVREAGARQAAPYIMVFWANYTKYNYTIREGNKTRHVVIYGHALVYDIYRVRMIGVRPVFEHYASGVVKPGFEINISPYVFNKFEYARAYLLPPSSPLGNVTLVLLGATLTEVPSKEVPTLLPPNLAVKALFVINLATNTSIVRYSDVNIPLIDFYPLGGSATSSAITRTGDYILVGSSDYNVYVFRLTSNKLYRVLYSVSLGSSVSTVETAPIASVAVAGGENGMAIAFDILEGTVYWRLPGQAAVTSISLIGSQHATIGTATGRLFAFTDARNFLSYLGIILEKRVANVAPEALPTPVTIRIAGVYQGLLVNITYNTTVEKLVSGSFYTLLPRTVYTLTLDNPVLGVANRTVSLYANVFFVLRVTDFIMPRYLIKICMNDSVTGLPLNNVKLILSYTPLPSIPPKRNYTLVIRKGCAESLLPRGYYRITISSWRYHPEPQGIEQPVKLYADTSINASATPYTATLIFRVVTTYGMPLSGVNITLREEDTGYTASVSTGGAGESRLSGVPYGIYTISFQYPYTIPYRARIIVNSSVVYVNATLKPRVYYVTVIAVDAETGAPIPGAALKLVRSYDGYTVRLQLVKGYTLLRLEYGEYSAEVSALGYEPQRLTIIVSNDTSVRVPLTPIYYTVTIEVIDSRYQRHLPAHILLVNEKLLKSVEKTTANGIAVFQLRAGVYRVTVTSPYALKTTTRLVVPSTTHFIVELVPRNYTVKVVPLDSEAMIPIARLGYNASGVISCTDTGNWALSWVNGSLVATIPYSRGCTLTVKARGYQPYSLNIGDITSNKVIEASLTPRHVVLHLQVYSEYGIALQFNATLKETKLGVVYHASGAGKATIRVRPGNYTVTIEALYHSPYHGSVSVENETTVKAVLKPRLYTLSLTLVDVDTGRRVERATLVITRVAPKEGKPVTVSLAGGVASLPLPWGTYRITVVAPGYQERSVVVSLPAERVTIELSPILFKVIVRVIDSLNKRPIPNASVSFYGEKSGVAVQARTDEKGIAALQLRADVYRVVAIAPMHLGRELLLNLVNATGEQGITLALDPVRFTLTLNFIDSLTGTPYKGSLSITFERGEGGYKKTFNVTGPSVSFTLPYGNYTVTVKAPRYSESKLNINLKSSIVKRVSLDREKYTVTVKVIDARLGGPVSNAVVTITLLPQGLTVFTGITNNKGETSATIPWGEYLVTIEAGGYRKASKVIRLTTSNLVVPVFLEPLPVKIVMNLLPAGIIGGAIVGSAAWVVRRIRKRPVALELEEELGE